MKSMVACLPADVGLAEIADALTSVGVVEKRYDDPDSAHDIIVRRGESKLAVDLDREDEVEQQYPAGELDVIRRTVGAFSGYVISDHDADFAVEVVRALAQRWPLAADDDQGRMAAAADFLARKGE